MLSREQKLDTEEQPDVSEQENSPELEVLLFDMCPIERVQRENTLYV